MINCEHKKTITVQSVYEYDLIPDDEPYENGMVESVSELDGKMLDGLELEISVGVCCGCKKILLYTDSDTITISKENNESL